MEYTLTMTFLNAGGDKIPLNISDVKANLTESEITSLMDSIIAKDIFISKGSSYTTKYGAQVTQKQITKLVM